MGKRMNESVAKDASPPRGLSLAPRPLQGELRVGQETHHKMESSGSSKEALMMEAPPVYTASPRLLGQPCKKLLIVVVVVVVAVLFFLSFLLVGLHMTEKHTEMVLQMTIQGLDGEGSPQHLSMSRKERLATFHVNMANSSAIMVYDYSNLLIGCRSWPGESRCYVSRMKKENIQSLDAAIKAFQHAQLRPLMPPLKESEEEMEGLSVPLADRPVLGTTINILCSSVPIYWA
ncbi:pulmonary surfactant-associated protein C-like [Rhineura floridana]|uniref:pulmonary surfactant-associated protein C-like n=1 Tax=Rhineura floridana TaxID=261503 RepID=UPI002AC894C5|nr:pulmonary surfactant-associated protein C-like [Rhineura floridana]